jgi:hypothetical protein
VSTYDTELYVLSLFDEINVWAKVPVKGKKPDPRVKMSMRFSHPNLILFGGSDPPGYGTKCYNDVQVLDMSARRAFEWTTIVF